MIKILTLRQINESRIQENLESLKCDMASQDGSNFEHLEEQLNEIQKWAYDYELELMHFYWLTQPVFVFRELNKNK